ncbi:MAG: DUF58 domain-containing protein [Sandaracinus sp.]|nr:DUF58 domain-containing protein [Sandaracinus sp.]MCB9616610.1 DUF58 domain-containing protein [Sandaracinus sp.]MCB9624345.1 DUF58 domain-containing protein [Sandaracinus sp.]MCB9634307.1 DUF58 domain-containing protein [Sandaracinus sp.]
MIPSPRLLWLTFAGLAVATLPVAIDAALWPLVAGLWAVLIGGMLVDAVVLLRARPELETDVPTAVGVGDDLEVFVRMRHRSVFPLRATFRSEVDLPLLPRGDVDASARRTTEVVVPVAAPRRGGARLRALWTRLDGPLRFLRRIDRHSLEDEVAVVPNAERVRELALAHFGAQRYGGVHVVKRRGDGGELDSLEAYEPGMDLRTVDWKASARHQAPLVRRFRLEQNQRIVLCVDTGRLMGDPIDGLERLDHAIHASLLLSQVALKAGDLVAVHAYSDGPRAWAPLAGGVRQVARIRRTLATLAAEPTETNHVLGIHVLLQKLKRRSLVVVFTELADSTTAELMVEHLGHLAKRHLVVFVALDDPVVQDAIAAPPTDAESLAGTAIAGGLRADRERVLRRLRRMGVDVIHAPPGPAALQLLARYVHIKRRGLIG